MEKTKINYLQCYIIQKFFTFAPPFAQVVKLVDTPA